MLIWPSSVYVTAVKHRSEATANIEHSSDDTAHPSLATVTVPFVLTGGLINTSSEDSTDSWMLHLFAYALWDAGNSRRVCI